MIRVAQSANPLDARLLLGVLESHGIRACIQGEALWAARGELPLTPESARSVWVTDEAGAERLQLSGRSSLDMRGKGATRFTRPLDPPRATFFNRRLHRRAKNTSRREDGHFNRGIALSRVRVGQCSRISPKCDGE